MQAAKNQKTAKANAMKQHLIFSHIGIMSFGALFILQACRKHQMPEMDSNLTYPAAYVVNGESNTLSVIRLSDNTLSDELNISNSSMGGMLMWPHHVYHTTVDGLHKLAIAMPGMDLSEGHSSTVDGMKGRIAVMDANKGTVIKELEVPVMNHNAVFSPDGKEIWTSQMETNGKVLVYNAETFELTNTIAVGKEPAEVTFSSDGSKAYVANGGDNTVSVINPIDKSVIATVSVGANPVGAWVGYDGKMYVDNEEGQSISVIDVSTNTVIQTIDLGYMPGSAAHNATKKELWVTDPDNGKVHFWLWNEPTSQWVHGGIFDTGAGAHAVAFTSDGRTAYVTNQMAGNVSVIQVDSHSRVKDINVGKKPNGIVIKQ